MLFEIILALLFGLTAGTFTGLTPGIHINLISTIILSLSTYLLALTSPIVIASFIIAMSITHTFIDSIPSIYLGAPDESTALAVLPGHKMLLEGKGHQAITLTVIGGLTSITLAIILSPILIPTFKILYNTIRNYIGYILIAIMAFMILKDNKKYLNFIFFITSGILGMIIFSIPNLNNPLLPLLSGLFGISLLIISINDNTTIPIQKTDLKLEIDKSTITKATIGATFVASIAAFLPGFGSSQSAIVAKTILRKLSDKGFIILIGGINTVNMTVSILTYYTLEKARNGSIIAISQIATIDRSTLPTYIIVAFISAILASALTLRLSIAFSKLISRINYKNLVLCIITIITILTIIFSGLQGIIILITATALGIAATQFNIGKNHLMGCLILPVIIYLI